MNSERPPAEKKRISRRGALRLGFAAAIATKVGLEAESAQAVEIAENLTLEQGFEQLHKAVFSEGFETAADAVVLLDGKTIWSYTEGKVDHVKMTWSDSVVSGKNPSELLEVGIHAHNHPIASIKGADGFGALLEGHSDAEIENLVTGPSWGDAPANVDTTFSSIKFQQYLKREGRERGVFAVVEAGGVWLYRLARLEDFLESEVGKHKLDNILDANKSMHGLLQKKIMAADIDQLAGVIPGDVSYLLDKLATENYVEFDESTKDKKLRLFWYPPESDSKEDLRLSFARFLAHKELWLDFNTMRGRESDGSVALGLTTEELTNYSRNYRQLLRLEIPSSDGWLELRQALMQSSIGEGDVDIAVETFTQKALVNHCMKIQFVDKNNFPEIRSVANQLADTAFTESKIRLDNGFW